MNKMLRFFGFLDILIFIIALINFYNNTICFENYKPSIISSILYSLILVSGIFLLFKNIIGIYLYYLLFVFRILFYTLSFGFLVTLARYFNIEENIVSIFGMFIIILEVLRLFLTYLIHKNL